MQRFEYVEGSHNKFWAIGRRGNAVTTSWGRIGTAGQSNTKSFATGALAETELVKLVAAKTRAGYKAVARSVAAARPSQPRQSAKPPTGRKTTATAVPEGALTLAELWSLGEAIKAKASRKLSGRLDIDSKPDHGGHGKAGTPSMIPSKNGQLRLGDLKRLEHSVLLKAAPGNGRNQTFLVTVDIGGSARKIKGVRLSDAMPVAWQPQKPLRVPRMGGTLPNVGVWTPGMKMDDLCDYGGFCKAKDGCGLDLGATLSLSWVLGLDANGCPACVLLRAVTDAMFALRKTPIAKPTGAELEQARSAPHRNALPAAELWAFGEAIRKHDAKPVPKEKADSYHSWSDVPPFSERLTVSFWPDSRGRVPSVGGEVCFGNLADPDNAIRIKASGADNRTFKYSDLRGGRFVHGLRLSNELPVRWETQDPFMPNVPWPKNRREARIGFWSPGIERTKPDHFEGSSKFPQATKGVLSWDTGTRRPVSWVLGLDAKGRPACVVADRDLDPRSFDHGREPLGAEAADAANVNKSARAKAEAEEAAEHPLTPASKAELSAIAAAIAAGPTKRSTKVTKRFALSWNKAIPTVEGKLGVGDPNGADFEIEALVDGAKPVFIFSDEEHDDGGAVVGVRLGDGKAVQWKPSFGMGVDSGKYGVWSPGFPTDDVKPFGTRIEGALVAYILQTENGDCGFPSLLGLDAAKKPVAFLFGEGLRPDVFKLARRPLGG